MIAARRSRPFAPADRRWRRRSGSVQRERRRARRGGGAGGPAGRLETVQKVCTDRASRPETDLDDDLDEGPFMSGSA
jgi:hypothetical protein